MIRPSPAAVPRRLPVLWSKAAVFGLVEPAVAMVGVFAAFLFGNRIVSGTPAAKGFSHAGAALSLLGAALYLGLVGVIGTAPGSLLRSVAGGSSVFVAVLIPGLALLLPSSRRDDITRYLPSNADESMFALTHDIAGPSLSAGPLVFLGWTARLGRLAAAAERAWVARDVHDMIGHHRPQPGRHHRPRRRRLRRRHCPGTPHGDAPPHRRDGPSGAPRAPACPGRSGRPAGGVQRPAGWSGAAPAARLRRHRRPVRGRTRRGPRRCPPHPAVEALDSGVQLTVYRIVQEAPANFLRHAGAGARVHLAITALHARLTLRLPPQGRPPRGVALRHPRRRRR